MLQDLKNFHNPVIETTLKWQKIFSENPKFIFNLCDEFVEQDKFYAIAQALRLTKYKLHVEELENVRNELNTLKLNYRNEN